jgi:hypothetical protein
MDGSVLFVGPKEMGVPVLFDSVEIGRSGQTPILSFSRRGEVIWMIALEDVVWKYIHDGREA